MELPLNYRIEKISQVFLYFFAIGLSLSPPLPGLGYFRLAAAYQRSVADKPAEREFLTALEIDPAHHDARHKFARKRYDDQYKWTPSKDVVAAIVREIFG